MTQPGMLHARILRPPAHGATLKEVDTAAAEKIPGVRVVRDNDLIAALHEHRDIADRALGLMRARLNLRAGRRRSHDLRPPVERRTTAATGGRERQPGRRREASHTRGRRDLLKQLRGSCGNGNALGSRRDRGRQIDGVGEHADSLPRPPQLAQAVGFAPENVRVITPYVGGRIRRQERVAPSGRSSAPWPRSRASRCRWCGTAPRNFSTIRSGRPPL